MTTDAHKFTPVRFWKKLAPNARGIGRGAVEKALYLYYALQNPATPKWARRVIYGALGYKAQAHRKMADWFGTPASGWTDA